MRRLLNAWAAFTCSIGAPIITLIVVLSEGGDYHQAAPVITGSGTAFIVSYILYLFDVNVNSSKLWRFSLLTFSIFAILIISLRIGLDVIDPFLHSLFILASWAMGLVISYLKIFGYRPAISTPFITNT